MDNRRRWQNIQRQAEVFAARRTGKRFTVRSRGTAPRELRYLLGCMAGHLAMREMAEARLYETVASIQVGAQNLLA